MLVSKIIVNKRNHFNIYEERILFRNLRYFFTEFSKILNYFPIDYGWRYYYRYLKWKRFSFFI